MAGNDYDAIVVGSGPNGLAAAIRLKQEGLSVLLVEGHKEVGGGTRTSELTLPGYRHDVCSAVHPLAVLSPFFRKLPLGEYGLKWLFPKIAVAHPLDDGSAGAALGSLNETAALLDKDRNAYLRLIEPVAESLPDILPDLLSPFPSLRHPVDLFQFGIRGLLPASLTAQRFQTPQARGLWAGIAAHSMQPLNNWITSAIGMILLSSAHMKGWPLAQGGSGMISAALAAYFRSLGGEIRTGFWVKKLAELPTAKAVFFDVTPRQLLSIAGDRLPSGYARKLKSYRYGMGVFKIDWALSEAVPFRNVLCRKAGTVHLGGTYEEIAGAEKAVAKGNLPDNPFVLFVQPGVVDGTRAPGNTQVAWAYCHVPHGSAADMTEAVERQIERFAPGFRDIILARSTMNALEMEQYNPNYVGGDINGGIQDIYQHFARPVLSISPYRTPVKGVYLCSSSTPPGGGVHGMCGYHAATRALKDNIF